MKQSFSDERSGKFVAVVNNLSTLIGIALVIFLSACDSGKKQNEEAENG